MWRDAGADASAAERCPQCGGALERVERAGELVGLRALHPDPSTGGTIADHVRAVIAHNDAARAARLADTRRTGPEQP